MNQPAPEKKPTRWVIIAFLGICLLVLLFPGLVIWHREDEIPLEVRQLNNEGVALMEQFAYEKAKPYFEEVVQKAPDWTPGKINLAIATLNLNTPETTESAAVLCLEVLQREPKHAHANYLLGIIYYFRRQYAEAYPYFKAVTEIDPNDAYSWYYCGDIHPDGKDSPEAFECWQRALKADPYLNIARYKLAQHPAMNDPAKRKQMLTEHEALRDAFWEVETRIRYYDMGPYARVIGAESREASSPKIGPIPLFEKWDGLQVTLAEGSRWATRNDLGWEEDDGKRSSKFKNFFLFGPVLIQFDYDGDGKTDLLLLSAVIRDGKPRNLLLKNEGGGKFTDVTAKSGLGEIEGCIGAAAGDFDNDGFPDLCLNGPHRTFLLRNRGDGRFEDVSAQAGFDQFKATYHSSVWVDLDQDGDLDLLLLTFVPERGKGGPTLETFVNKGLAPLVPLGQKAGPLSVAFEKLPPTSGLTAKDLIHSVILTDIDSDQDIDILLFDSRAGVTSILNDRLLRFRSVPFLPPGLPKEKLSGRGLSFDANHDGRADLLLMEYGPPRLMLSAEGPRDPDPTKWFRPGVVKSPPIARAFAVDLDLDSWTDLVGFGEDRMPHFLQNDGLGRLVDRPDTFGLDLPDDILTVACLDLDGDCFPDLLLWTEHGLFARKNLGNGNRAVRVQLTGKRSTTDQISERTNADGIGAMVTVQSGDLRNSQEYTTLTAGMGQALVPLDFGIGRNEKAEVVRIRWPDLIPQAELKIDPCKLLKVGESNRKPTSCPTLLVWDGEKFRFVSDILGAASMGELGADGSTRPPRPEESFKIEPGLLKPKDGKLLLKIAEPMDETMYLDRFELICVDHPKSQFVYPDERFPTDQPPSQELLLFDRKIFPMKVTDHRGRDRTWELREWDGIQIDDFAHRRWLGFAEEHSLEFDFGDALKPFGKDDRLYLCLAGWTDYAYPESIFAAAQAKIDMLMPTLEVPQPDGSWKPLLEVSIPAGLPRMMTREVTGLTSGRFRIRTNLQVYWDQIFLAPRLKTEAISVSVPMSNATLTHRGFIKEIPGKGRGPISYDDSQTERVEVTAWQGRFTKLGDVTEILTHRDDHYAICGPGDELTLSFDAKNLPALKDGWERSFVLRSWGYCKDTTPFTAHGGKVHPLPYRDMGNYPPSKSNPAQEEYDRKWNTREPFRPK